MFCRYCGNKLRDSSRFCTSCGMPTGDDNAQTAETNSDSKRRETFHGTVDKCPRCGNPVTPLDLSCPLCGHEFTNTSASQSITEFSQMLAHIEQATLNSGASIVIAASRKADYIRTYPIPNNKSDLMQFMILASSNVDMQVLSANDADDIGATDSIFSSRRIITDAWLAKIEQIHSTAGVMMEGDELFNDFEELYKKTISDTNAARQAAAREAKADKKENDRKIRREYAQQRKIAKLQNSKQKKEISPKAVKSIVVGAVIAAIFIALFVSVSSYDNEREKKEQEKYSTQLVWPNYGIAKKLPLPDSTTGEVESVSGKEIEIDVYNVSEVEYGAYIEKCKEAGFTNNAETTSLGYSAYSSDGYYLDITHYSSHDTMTIKLEAPIEVSDINWDDLKLGSIIPVIEQPIGYIEKNTGESLNMQIASITANDYQSYVSKCKEMGYTIDSSEGESSYSAFNNDGDKISLQYDNSVRQVMSVSVSKAKEYSEIQWPTSGLATNLPTPTSNIGEIYHNSDSWFCAYVKMSKEEFASYVDKCAELGFTEKMYYSDSYYSADNSAGMDLTIDYLGYDTVRISLTNY